MRTYILSILLLYTVVGFAQEEHSQNILEADSTWFKEVIKFPISFAKEIDYQGFEELRFAPGFTKLDSDELWSYTWAWVIENESNITTEALEANLQFYFDGLLNLNPKYNKDKSQQTVAVLTKNKAPDSDIIFTGKLKTTDTRYTKKPLTLYINGEQEYCKALNKIIVIFRLSPQSFEHSVWKKLNTITIKENLCSK